MRHCWTSTRVAAAWVLCALAGHLTALAQGTPPAGFPSREYVRLGGRVVAIEHPSVSAPQVTPSAVVLPTSGGTGSVVLESHRPVTWSVRKDPDSSTTAWLTLTNPTGTMTDVPPSRVTLGFSAAATAASQQRTVQLIVRVSVPGGAAQNLPPITVTQGAGAPSVTFDPTSTQVPAMGNGARTLVVRSNAAWTATANAAFVTLTRVNGGTVTGGVANGTGNPTTGETLEYTVADNTAATPRTGGIVVTTTPSATFTHTITQDGSNTPPGGGACSTPTTGLGSGNTASVGAGAGITEFAVTSTTAWTATVIDGAAWLSVESLSSGPAGGPGNNPVQDWVRARFTGNATSAPRTGTIRVTSTCPGTAGSSVNVFVTQVRASLTIAPTNSYLDPGATLQLTAYNGGVPVTPGQVQWSLNSPVGTISASGLYTAPPPPQTAPAYVLVTATMPTAGNATATTTVSIRSSETQGYPPALSSLTPARASGTGGTFAFAFSNPAGMDPIARADMRIGGTADSAAYACHVTVYTLLNTPGGQNYTVLADDAGTGFVQPSFPPANTFNQPTLGLPGSLENSQCRLDLPTSLQATSGSTSLTENLSLSFKSAFAGPRAIHHWAANPFASMPSYMTASGDWAGPFGYTVQPTPNRAPTADGVTPNGLAGEAQQFTAVYKDEDGVRELGTTQLLVGSIASAAGTCFVEYRPAQNAFYLMNDAGNAWLGPYTARTAFTAENSQCRLHGPGSAVLFNDNERTLTVYYALSFKGAYAGARVVWSQAWDKFGAYSGWQARANYTVQVPNQAPSVVSVAPSGGTGTSQAFRMTFSDPNGAADLRIVHALLGPVVWGPGSCFVHYNQETNRLHLIRDDGGDWLQPGLVPGAGGTVENLMCRVSDVAVATSGNTLTLTGTVAFLGSFAGPKKLYALALDRSGLFNAEGWREMGTWTVPGNAAPTADSATVAGTSTGRTVTVTVSDANGTTNLWDVHVIVHSALTAANSCYVSYNRTSQTLTVMRDDASDWHPAVGMGTSAQVGNSQCTLHAASSSVAVNGNTLTLTLSLSFTQAFAGTRNVYLLGQDNGLVQSGWHQKATFTIPSTPTLGTLTPASGAGLVQTFTANFTDADGAVDIRDAVLLIHSALGGGGACWVRYHQPSNTLYIVNPDGTVWTQPTTAGTTGTLTNGACTLNAAGSGAVPSGNTLAVTFQLTFSPSFAGARTAWIRAHDLSGANSGFEQRGTWYVPVADGNQAEVAAISVPSAVTPGQSFTATVAMRNVGSTTWRSVGAGEANPWRLGSQSPQDNGRWGLHRVELPVATVAPGHTATFTISATAPATAGTYDFAWRMLREGVAWFGATASATTNVQFAATAQPPQTVSFSPQAGTTSSATVSAVFSDPNGADDINNAFVLIGREVFAHGACYVQYWRADNRFYLFQDDGTWGTGVAPGSGQVRANSMCEVTAPTITRTGTQLRMDFAVTFKPAFAGDKNVWMVTTDQAGTFSGGGTWAWEQRGTWTVPGNVAPTITVGPANGSGAAQAFTASMTDANGFQNVLSMHLLFSAAGVNGANACYVYYRRSDSQFYLRDDANSAWLHLGPNAGDAQANSQCTLHRTGTGVSGSGSTLGVTANLTFTGAFAGAKTVYAYVDDNGWLASGWQSHGSWTVPSVGVSVSPASVTVASSRSQQFTATVTGTGSTGVTWTTSRGTISASGVYTAPSDGTFTPGTIATVTATSVADPTKSASASVTLAGLLTVYNPTLGPGQSTTAISGWPDAAWSVSPAGMGTFSPATGNAVTYTAPSVISAAQTVTMRATWGTQVRVAYINLVP